jgi:hypothetical protein
MDSVVDSIEKISRGIEEELRGGRRKAKPKPRRAIKRKSPTQMRKKAISRKGVKKSDRVSPMRKAAKKQAPPALGDGLDYYDDALELYKAFDKAEQGTGVEVGKLFDERGQKLLRFSIFTVGEGTNARVGFNKLINKVLGKKVKLDWKGKKVGRWRAVEATVNDLYNTKGVVIKCRWIIGQGGQERFPGEEYKDSAIVFIRYFKGK